MASSSSSSSVLTRVNSALDLEDCLVSRFSDVDAYKKHRYRLRNLKTFVLLSGKFGNDVDLRSLLRTMEHSFRRIPDSPGLENLDAVREVITFAGRVASDFPLDFQSLKEGVDGCYITTSDSTPQSNSLTADEVGEISASILENLVDLPSFSLVLAEAMEPLREHMNFLKNLCGFATSRGVDHGQMKDFLAHTIAFAISAAHLCFLCGDAIVGEESGKETDSEADGQGWLNRMQSKISMLIQKIEPTDPKVCETYTHVIRCSKLSPRLDASTSIKEMEDEEWRKVMEFRISALLREFKLSDSQVCMTYSRPLDVPTHIQEMEDDSMIVMKNFVDSLIFIIWEMLRLDTRHVASLKDHSQVLYEGLRALRTILKKLQPKDIDEKTRDDIGGMVCDAGVLVFSCYHRNVEIDIGLQDLWKRIKVFLPEASTSSHVLPSQKMASVTTEVVGFQDEEMWIRDRLRRGSSNQLRVIAMVGMGGIGKTTLVEKVFYDPQVMDGFHARARCTVTQTLDKKKLLLELLDQIHTDKCCRLTYDEDDDESYLVDGLGKHLRKKRYLIFLDDVWTIEAWNSLEASFPDDSKGSRIILTSRNYDAVPPADKFDVGSLFLRQLDEKESLELLQKKLFPGEKVWPHALNDLGMQIVKICKGLPLKIVLVAELLATTEQKGGFSSGIASITEHCMNTLEPSYKHLPDDLKRCFLYFGAFPKDREVSVRRLIRLWIAEKLVSPEDDAGVYMKDLINRSLIMVAEQGSMGDVKTCRIHDVLHDFCLRKAKGDHFLHLVKGYDELLAFNEPFNLRRLSIHSESEHLKESKIFCPRVRSLLFFSSLERLMHEKEASIGIFHVHIFKFVIVLDLEGIHLGEVFPSEIQHLEKLRYLAIRVKISVIPPWVGKLSMLETFIVDPCVSELEVSLPDTIWNLKKLKYLYIRSYDYSAGGELPIENLDNSSDLRELDTFSGAVFISGDSMEKQMGKFLKIRKLKCMLSRRWDDTKKCHIIAVPGCLSLLESLTMVRMREPRDHIHLELSFPANLKKLTLGEFHLPWSQISTIGKLLHLEVLKLLSHSFQGETWEVKEGEFPALRYLKLFELDLVNWTGSDDQFPCLEKLVLDWCHLLEEMPSCLERSTTLEMIGVRCCSEATTAFVKRIKAGQRELGNSAFKMLIQSSDGHFEE